MAGLNRLITVTLLLLGSCSAYVLPYSKPSDDLQPLPLIVWHGLGDNYAAEGLKELGNLAEDVNPGTYVYNIRLDEDPSNDRSDSFFGNVTTQLQQVCEDLAANPILSTAPAVNALGLSQGGVFLRAYVERCNSPPVRNLVTFGSPHNGISKFKDCGPTDWLCQSAVALLRGNTWSSFVQSRVVPAQYYREPEELDKYLESSNFLADVNNERDTRNETYGKNLNDLNKFVMFMFDEDETLIPKQSAWFAEVNETSGKVIKLQDRAIYQQDWLGLQSLDQSRKLEFLTAPGKHMHLGTKLLKEVFETYFGPVPEESENRYQFKEQL